MDTPDLKCRVFGVGHHVNFIVFKITLFVADGCIACMGFSS